MAPGGVVQREPPTQRVPDHHRVAEVQGVDQHGRVGQGLGDREARHRRRAVAREVLGDDAEGLQVRHHPFPDGGVAAGPVPQEQQRSVTAVVAGVHGAAAALEDPMGRHGRVERRAHEEERDAVRRLGFDGATQAPEACRRRARARGGPRPAARSRPSSRRSRGSWARGPRTATGRSGPRRATAARTRRRSRPGSGRSAVRHRGDAVEQPRRPFAGGGPGQGLARVRHGRSG